MSVIRPVQLDDLAALTDIYNYYIRETAITFDLEPKTLDQRKDWLEGFSATGRYRCLVMVRDGAPIGWASSSRYRDRAAYDTTVETSIYLAPDCHGRGLGRQLYAALFDTLAGEDIHRAYAGITQPNGASNGLHTALGFREAGLLPQVGRKFGRFWDVAVWLRPFDGAAGGT